MTTITSKYNGTCKKCGGTIEKGEKITWSKERGAEHLKCPEQKQQQPLRVFHPCPKPGKASSPQRFHHVERAYRKAEQAVNQDAYWGSLLQQAEREVALAR